MDTTASAMVASFHRMRCREPAACAVLTWPAVTHFTKEIDRDSPKSSALQAFADAENEDPPADAAQAHFPVRAAPSTMKNMCAQEKCMRACVLVCAGVVRPKRCAISMRYRKTCRGLTLAILAQGTNWADASAQAYFVFAKIWYA